MPIFGENFSFYNHFQVTTRENSRLDSLGNDHGAWKRYVYTVFTNGGRAGKILVPNHENEALEDNKHKFLTDSTVLVNLQSGDFFFLQRFGGLFLL